MPIPEAHFSYPTLLPACSIICTHQSSAHRHTCKSAHLHIITSNSIIGTSAHLQISTSPHHHQHINHRHTCKSAHPHIITSNSFTRTSANQHIITSTSIICTLANQQINHRHICKSAHLQINIYPPAL
jgi:hypothetical protein